MPITCDVHSQEGQHKPVKVLYVPGEHAEHTDAPAKTNGIPIIPAVLA